MARPKNSTTRTYVCTGRLNRGTNAHAVLRDRRISASVLFDATLDHLERDHAGETLTGNESQLLATKVARELGMNRGAVNARSRIATVGRAVNAWNLHVKHNASPPRRRDGRPARTIETYADGHRHERPLVVVNEGGNATLRFPGLPPVRLLTTRPLPADQPTYASVSVDGRRVQVQLVYRTDQEPLPADRQWNPYRVLGLDLGIVDLVASSAGISHEGISQKKLQDRIKTAQKFKQAMVGKAVKAGLAGFRAVLDEDNRQVLSTKGTPRRYLHWVNRKPTREYRRAARRLSGLLGQRARQRRNYRHRVAAQTVRHCADNGISLIAMEKLNIKGMTKSARGTVGNPGRQVAQKRGLNRRILQQGWAELTTLIRYKARAKGIRVVGVNVGGTSQTCSECGLRDAKSRRGKQFRCTGCSHPADADTNAALNIGDRGTYIYERRRGASLDDVRRQRLTGALTAAQRHCQGSQTPATGTDDTACTRSAPRAKPVPTFVQLHNSSQLALW